VRQVGLRRSRVGDRPAAHRSGACRAPESRCPAGIRAVPPLKRSIGRTSSQSRCVLFQMRERINGPAQGQSGITPSPRFEGIDAVPPVAPTHRSGLKQEGSGWPSTDHMANSSVTWRGQVAGLWIQLMELRRPRLVRPRVNPGTCPGIS
jgi:hypothetical protein